VSRFTEISELQGAGVSMVACGEDFTIAASKERAWGFGNGAKLGLGHAHRDDCLRPALIRGIPTPIRKIVSGWGHTLALAGDEVLAWGWNLHGQCGLGHKDFVAEACTIQGLAGLDVVDIAAGATHSLALTRAGAVLVWGSHADGKLGLGDPVVSAEARSDLLAPHRLKEEAFAGLGVVGLAAGADHTAAITEDGGLWLWGFGQHGALGFAEGTNENRPRRLTGLPGAVEIVSCGMDVTVVRVRE
jgi:alpha-tubulin suppressor-like RCC1 family protein